VVPLNSLSNTAIHGTIRRRKSDDSVGGEQSRTSQEPPAKRVRMEPEVDTTVAPSMPTPRAAIPGAATSGPSDLVTSPLRSLSPDRVAMDEESNYGNNPPSFNQQPFVKPQTEAIAVGSRETQVVGDTSMPPIEDLSLAPSEIKPNPFTASRISLQPLGVFPPLGRSTVIQDVEHLSLPAVTVDDARGSVSVATLQEPPQETYVFSAAEIRTLVASRGSDEDSCPNKFVFNLDWGLINGITRWRNFKAGQG
jgi:hypothetical protein